jgi:N-acetylneuraminate synthase/N,N'-diacetyllegionaminate synthase
MAYGSEINSAVNTVKCAGNDKLILLHCVSSYPANPNEINMRKMELLKYIFPSFIVGYSDHFNGIEASLLAVSLGAKMIEKHFTSNKYLKGQDQWFSADSFEMKELIKKIRLIENMFGDRTLKPTERELEMRKIAHRVKTKEGYFRGTI